MFCKTILPFGCKLLNNDLLTWQCSTRQSYLFASPLGENGHQGRLPLLARSPLSSVQTCLKSVLTHTQAPARHSIEVLWCPATAGVGGVGRRQVVDRLGLGLFWVTQKSFLYSPVYRWERRGGVLRLSEKAWLAGGWSHFLPLLYATKPLSNPQYIVN